MLQRVIFVLLFVALFPTFIFCQNITLQFFQDKPRSFLKDFYISQFLDQNITSNEAKALVGDVHNMNYRLFYKFADKIDDFKRVKYCLKLDAKYYEGKSADCIAMGLSGFKATKLPSKTLINISDSIKNSYPKLADKYKLIATRSFKTLIDAKDELTISTFNSVGKEFRRAYYNYKIPPAKVNGLSGHKAFNTMVETIVRDLKLKELQKSIIKFDSSSLNAKTNFLLALNAIKHNRDDVAIWYLKLSQKKAKLQFDKDKVLFWKYLLTKDVANLTKLTKSKDINIYTLFAHERLKLSPKGIKTSLLPKKIKPPFDVSEPFAWIRVKNSFYQKKYNSYEDKRASAMKLNSDDTLGHVAKLIYKFSLNEHYFFKPYSKYLSDISPKRVALILAIARQESRFIPTAVSYSYALGLMQFMPYVAKDIAKENGFKDFRYEDMFKPKIAYKFANIHLDFLEKSLYHPLIIAYAYNGGIGFTKRQILTKDYFKDGKYEPYLSLEMVPNAQARKYGKIVLANYVIYAKLLGIDLTLKTLLNTLKPPHRISRF